MPDVNLPPNHPLFDKTALNGENISPLTSNSSSIPISQDSLTSVSPSDLTSTLVNRAETPSLQVPSTSVDSHFFRIFNQVTSMFRRQLRVSDYVDQATRLKISQNIAIQANSLSDTFEEREKLKNQGQKEAQQATHELQKQLEEIKKQIDQGQEFIQKINEGNIKEQEAYQKLIQAHDHYLQELKKLEIVDHGNGKYLIPEQVTTQYQALTKDYEQAIKSFNTYWAERLQELQKYNSLAMAYNQDASINHQFLSNFINTYQLVDFIKKEKISLPNQQRISLRNLSEMKQALQIPEMLSSSPLTMAIYPVPNYARTIANFGPPNLPQLENYIPLNTQIFSDTIYQNLYGTRIAALDQQIYTQINYWAYLNINNRFNSVEDSSSDPLLNSKKLLKRLLPDAIIASKRPIKSTTGMFNSIIQTTGLNAPDTINHILGLSLFKQFLAKNHLHLLEGKDEEYQEKKTYQFMDRLLLLSIGLISNDSLLALLPGLSVISDSFPSLPKDSPAFALLFTISFANRIQENAKHGITKEALELFMNHSLDFADLSEKEKSELEAMLNLGLLLIASKLLEGNLGLPGMLTPILLSLLQKKEATALLEKSKQENTEQLLNLKTQLTQAFIERNYSKEETDFLAHFATQLVVQGLLTPTITPISVNTVNQELLQDSLTASLILSGYSLNQASSIVQQAIQSTLQNGPYPSSSQCRAKLESVLQDLNVETNLSQVSREILLVPPQNSDLFNLSNQIELSPNELITIVEKRIFQLLNAQLGTNLTQQISAEVIKTLFGSPLHSQEQLNASYSLINSIQNQLDQLNLKENPEYLEAVSQTFKETLKMTEDLYSFSLKMMDPAYLFIYSAYIGNNLSYQNNYFSGLV